MIVCCTHSAAFCVYVCVADMDVDRDGKEVNFLEKATLEAMCDLI